MKRKTQRPNVRRASGSGKCACVSTEPATGREKKRREKKREGKKALKDKGDVFQRGDKNVVQAADPKSPVKSGADATVATLFQLPVLEFNSSTFL